MYSAFEEAVKPNRSPIKLSQWSACCFTKWMNEGVRAGKRKQDEAKSIFIYLFIFLPNVFMPPLPWQALSREGLQRNWWLNAKPAIQGPTAPRGLRPPSTSFVPLGGSVQQDQRLDIRQVHITSPGVRLGQKHTTHSRARGLTHFGKGLCFAAGSSSHCTATSFGYRHYFLHPFILIAASGVFPN